MSLGVAMIARNGADTMEAALAPFVELADEVSIVFGGQSTDNTETIAAKYATVTDRYDGPVDNEGALLDFGYARQQSFDLLTTDWTIVVDCDDVWHNPGLLPSLVDQASKANAQAIQVAYHLPKSFFHQPRIFAADSGAWRWPVHEAYRINGDRPHSILTSDVSLQSVSSSRQTRQAQNIKIAEAWLADHPDDAHVLIHLAQDYSIIHEWNKALGVLARYFENETYTEDSRYLYGLYIKAVAEIQTGQFDLALQTGLEQVRIGGNAAGWLTVAQAAHILSEGKGGMVDLAILAADQALRSGKVRVSGNAQNKAVYNVAPLTIKAFALMDKGRLDEALAASDLGLTIDPKNKDLLMLNRQICQTLNVAQ